MKEMLKSREAVQILISLVLFIIALIVPFENVWINNIIYIISYLVIGLDIVINAIKNILKGEIFDENFLMSIATIGALIIGEFPEAVAVMLLYKIGELFQDYAVDKSRDSIEDLMNIRPDYANVERDNNIEKEKPETVKIGEIIVVKPGEKIPLDGIVIEGKSTLDTSNLTGESTTRNIKIGDEILSGCINQSGLLKIKVTKEFKESTVSKILELVENASSKKAKSEKFITKFAKFYTPIVVVIALIIAIIPPLVLQNELFIDWIYRALTFLMVSCPCALVISIPLSFFGGIGGASKKGILIKGSNYLELLDKTEIIVFDKTGTLTQGVFEVQKIEAFEVEQNELLKLAAYAESYSNHPIAISIKKAYNKEIDSTDISDISEISGKGIVAKIDEKNILVGNEKLMQENNVEYKTCSGIGTIVYVAINNKFVGYILIADKVKQDAQETITKLKKNNIKKIVMLTGDTKEIGESVANILKIGEVYTELLPNEKAEIVEKLLKEKLKKQNLAFVGDGINDAPVLALSDIGIAMGGLGSDAAIEAADVVIMNDEPSKILDAIKISKKTLRVVKQNIIFAISVKILVLILAALGISTMWGAVLADVGVSMIAILNSLRMLK